MDVELAEKAAEAYRFGLCNGLIREEQQVAVWKCLLDSLKIVRVSITYEARTAHASTQWCIQRRDFSWHQVVL